MLYGKELYMNFEKLSRKEYVNYFEKLFLFTVSFKFPDYASIPPISPPRIQLAKAETAEERSE